MSSDATHLSVYAKSSFPALRPWAVVAAVVLTFVIGVLCVCIRVQFLSRFQVQGEHTTRRRLAAR